MKVSWSHIGVLLKAQEEHLRDINVLLDHPEEDDSQEYYREVERGQEFLQGLYDAGEKEYWNNERHWKHKEPVRLDLSEEDPARVKELEEELTLHGYRKKEKG